MPLTVSKLSLVTPPSSTKPVIVPTSSTTAVIAVTGATKSAGAGAGAGAGGGAGGVVSGTNSLTSLTFNTRLAAVDQLPAASMAWMAWLKRLGAVSKSLVATPAAAPAALRLTRPLALMLK